MISKILIIKFLKKQIKWLDNNFAEKHLVVFWLCFSTSFLIFFFRNPDPIINPVFLAEDGSNYVGPILSYGFWESLTKARSDYLVIGNMMLSGLAVFLNWVFYRDNILHIPHFIAIVSYLFFALVATLPILLLHQRISIPYLIILALVTSFFPLGDSDFEVIGRISNIGYALVYVACLLMIYRNSFATKVWWKAVFVDVGVLLCSLTNPIVCLISPLIYWPYLKSWRNGQVKIRHLFVDVTFLSSVVLGSILSIQIILTAIGSSKVEGHLDSPVAFSNVIEMILGRSILYPLIYPFYKYLNDGIVIFLLALLLWIFVRFARRSNYDLYISGGYSLVVFSLTALAFRPGLTGILNNYSTSFPDRYFYGQNLFSILLLVLLIHDISLSLKSYLLRRRFVLLALVLLLYGAGGASTYGNPANSMREIGTFEQSLVKALESDKFVDASRVPTEDGKFLVVPIYTRAPPWDMIVPREIAERSVKLSSKQYSSNED